MIKLTVLAFALATSGVAPAVVEYIEIGGTLPPGPDALIEPLAEYRMDQHREFISDLAAVNEFVIPVSQIDATTPEPYAPASFGVTGDSDVVLPPVVPLSPTQLVQYHFPDEWVPWALAIMECESRGDPDAKNPRSTAAGLFQFLRSTWDWVNDYTGFPDYDTGAPYDPEMNVIQAAWLLENGGPSHWKCKASSLIP